jgi:hypothetical protein
MEQALREGFQGEAAGGNGAGKAAAPQPSNVTPLPAQKPLDLWPMHIALTFKPIKEPTKGELHELVLREPTAGDIARIGNPVKMDEGGTFVFEPRTMHFMIAALSGVMTPFLDQMDTRDWNTVAYRLLRFFLPGRGAWD